MRTFTELFEFLKTCDNIDDWMEDAWTGRDKQESLLRLLCGFNLVEKLKDFKMCQGNFNYKSFRKYDFIRELFYNPDNSPIYLKDSGDVSDLTALHKQNHRNLLVSTSKNLKELLIGNLDIEKIMFHFREIEKDYKMTLCVCVKSMEQYENMLKNIQQSSVGLKKILERKSTIIITWVDLFDAVKEFKTLYSNVELENIINDEKLPIKLKPHQKIAVRKTIKLKRANEKAVLWGIYREAERVILWLVVLCMTRIIKISVII